jgi:hypothetical protein
MAFTFYEPGNMNHELANNGSCDSLISIVSRLQGVKSSGLGSILSSGIPYKQIMWPLALSIQWVKGIKRPKFETEN